MSRSLVSAKNNRIVARPRAGRGSSTTAEVQDTCSVSHSGGDAMAAMMGMMGGGGAHDRNIYLAGEIEEHMMGAIISQLINLGNISDDPVNIIISTYGGNVRDMFALYDTMKFLKCTVHTIGLGKIMSAGVLLLAAGEKGKRLIGRNSRVMMHAVASGAFGNIFDIVNEVDEVKILQEKSIEAVAAETKLTKKKISQIYSTKLSNYIDAETALKYGIADKIIGLQFTRSHLYSTKRK